MHHLNQDEMALAVQYFLHQHSFSALSSSSATAGRQINVAIDVACAYLRPFVYQAFAGHPICYNILSHPHETQTPDLMV